MVEVTNAWNERERDEILINGDGEFHSVNSTTCKLSCNILKIRLLSYKQNK